MGYKSFNSQINLGNSQLKIFFISRFFRPFNMLMYIRIVDKILLYSVEHSGKTPN